MGGGERSGKASLKPEERLLAEPLEQAQLMIRDGGRGLPVVPPSSPAP